MSQKTYFIVMFMAVTLITNKYLITASGEGNVFDNLKTYFEEANYPEDESLEAIERDLKETLELFSCSVMLRD